VNSCKKLGEGSKRTVLLLARPRAILLWRHEIWNDDSDVIALRTCWENHCVGIGVLLNSFPIFTVSYRHIGRRKGRNDGNDCKAKEI